MFSYGFLTPPFTHDPTLAPALVLFIFYGIAAFAEHRSGEVNAFHLTTAQVVAVLLGTVTGVVFVGLSKSPRLVDARPFFGWDTVRNAQHRAGRDLWATTVHAWPAVFLFSLVALAHGVYFLLGGLWQGHESEGQALSKMHSLTVGIALAVAGTAFALLAVVRVAQTPYPNGAPGKLTVKYGIILGSLAFFPAFTYNALRGRGTSEGGAAGEEGEFAWYGAVALFVVVAAHAASYWTATRQPGPQLGGRATVVDPYFGGKNLPRARPFWGLLFSVHFFAFAVAYAADESSKGDVSVVLHFCGWPPARTLPHAQRRLARPKRRRRRSANRGKGKQFKRERNPGTGRGT